MYCSNYWQSSLFHLLVHESRFRDLTIIVPIVDQKIRTKTETNESLKFYQKTELKVKEIAI